MLTAAIDLDLAVSDDAANAIGRGRPAPLGATALRGGVNFSVYSRSAHAIDLLLFEAEDADRPTRTIALDPGRHRTYHYWHAFVSGIEAGQIYGYRAHGPYEPGRGQRFDPKKVLLDPYGQAVVVPKGYGREAARLPGDNTGSAMKSVVADPSCYDWEGDVPLQRPYSETVIYELHVRGFTRHVSAGVAPSKAGTYAGLIEKIPYLKDLGVTAVELLPVFQFDPLDAPPGLGNYWGYSPVSFFAPHRAYSSRTEPLGPLDEFRDMVKALHRAGIEVIVDVVFNHTSEGDHTGPTFCLRGLENETYYLLDAQRDRYVNFSGTGNTLNANHAVVRRLIRDSLRYWVEQMHVDGFRFDLASILSRDERGRPLENPPILWDIESDPVLAGTKLIAEAWDAAGLNQLGTFVGDAWCEWNGRFRDDVRAFMKADRGTVMRVARRMLGSPDIFGHEQREPEQSINFVTCHDGFTLNDLVSYDRKHNAANGEENRDGANHNLSWNCGVEGPTDEPAIEAFRNRQVKNFLALTVLSAGTPMLLMGDEVRRTQLGNNNAYCQDNETSWFDWTGLERHADIHRFTRLLNRLRSNPDAPRERSNRTLNESLAHARIEWHGVRLHQPDWSDESHSLALTAITPDGQFLVYVLANAFWEPLEFALPPTTGVHQSWRRLIDTGREAPHDIHALESAPSIEATSYRAEPRSVVVLCARRMDSTQRAGEPSDPFALDVS
jgi:isoamylase